MKALLRPLAIEPAARDLVMLGPLPQSDGGVGGVGLYDALALEAIGAASSRRVFALAQSSGRLTDIGHLADRVRVLRAWRPGIAALSDVWSTISRLTPGILHLQYEAALYGSGVVSLFLPGFLRRIRARGWKSVVTFHHFIGGDFGVEQLRLWKRAQTIDPLLLRLLCRVQREIAESADAVIVHEPGQRREMPRNARVFVIPHLAEARDLAPAREVARAGRRVLYYGFLAPYKGLEQLFDAFHLLAARGVDVTLDVIGGAHPRLMKDHTYRRFLQRLEASAGRSNAIAMHGYLPIPEVEQLMSRSQAAIFPYLAALSSSGAVSYAASFGLQILASNALSSFMGLDAEAWVRRFDVSPASIAACVEAWSAEPQETPAELSRWLHGRSLESVGRLHERAYKAIEYTGT